jgi:NAD(P)-dependent dehydrogenase (short-subunit alcohol dehydrogenase family)
MLSSWRRRLPGWRSAHMRLPFLGAYAATKAAVSALTRAAAREYIVAGIRINAIRPRTHRHAHVPAPRRDRSRPRPAQRHGERSVSFRPCRRWKSLNGDCGRKAFTEWVLALPPVPSYGVAAGAGRRGGRGAGDHAVREAR